MHILGGIEWNMTHGNVSAMLCLLCHCNRKLANVAIPFGHAHILEMSKKCIKCDIKTYVCHTF